MPTLRVSFLDRLKREADQQRMQAEQTARERDERELRYRTQIEPKMKALTQYLEGLVATLQEVRPPIVIRMPIQGYGELCTVPFWDYKVEPERRHRSYQITMTWSLRVDPERTPVVRAEGVTRVKTLTNVFRQHMLAGIKEEKRTPQGEISLATFHARGFVKAKFTSQISADDPVLRLVFENASWLGSSRRQVNWEQIDDSLFDRIARFIVREDDSLFTEEVPDELKQRLRKEPASPADSAAPPSVPAPAPPQAIAPIGTPPPAAAPAIAPDAMAAPRPAVRPPPADEPLPDVASGFIPGMIPAPAPVTEGEVIEIDESKLGLDQWQDSGEDSFGAFSFGSREKPAPARAEPAPPAPAVPAPAVPAPAAPAAAAPAAPRPAASPAVAPAAPPPAAQPPAAQPPAAPVARAPVPTAPSAPAPAASPAASAPVAAAAPSAPALPQARVAPPATMPAPAAAPEAARPATPPAAAAAASAPAAPSATPPGAGAKTPAEEETEREAALFRLKVRAMLARMRTTGEPGEGGS